MANVTKTALPFLIWENIFRVMSF